MKQKNIIIGAAIVGVAGYFGYRAIKKAKDKKRLRLRLRQKQRPKLRKKQAEQQEAELPAAALLIKGQHLINKK